MRTLGTGTHAVLRGERNEKTEPVGDVSTVTLNMENVRQKRFLI